MDTIQKAISGCFYTAILGTETSWDSNILSQEVFSNYFNVYRDDRDLASSGKKSGGGVLVAIKSIYDSERIESNKFSQFEHVWVKTQIEKDTHIFASVYFPPLSPLSSYEDFFRNAEQIISSLEPESKIHLYGDFNLSSLEFMIDDENESILIPIFGESENLQIIFDTIHSLGLSQINHVKNQNNRFLDLLFTNLTEDFCITDAKNPLWKNESHHTAIEFSQFVHKSDTRPEGSDYEEIPDYSKADYLLMKRRLLENDWSALLEGETNIDQAVNIFYGIIYDIFDECIPTRKRRRTNSKDPPWFTKEVKNLKNRKQKAHKIYKSCGTSHKLAEYLEICHQLDLSIQDEFEKYHRKVESEIKSDSKQFFNFVKTKLKSNNFPSNMHLDDKTGQNKTEICELFANFFESVYTSFDENDRSRNYFSFIPKSNTEITVDSLSLEEIQTALKSLDSSKSTGPDGISPKLIKNLASELAFPLHWLFNLSLRTGIFPSAWKKSYLVPIFKSGKRSDVKNYRGIALISCIPKLFEAIVNNKMFLQVKHYITEKQHGFFKGRSTATNLLTFVNFTLNEMDNKKSVQTLYTDFSKAFDRVDISMLLFKLDKIGIDSNLLAWLKSYLTNRTQCVKFDGFLSRLINVTSGVPQGSHLGPLLFILYVNDISFVLKHVNVSIYADDMKLFMSIKDEADGIVFQNEIDIFYEWCNRSLLQLNIKKCTSILFSRKINKPNITVKLDNQLVGTCSNVRDLGVILDSKMSFVEHYNTIILKATNMLNFIKRFSYNFQDPYTLKTLFIAYVRSILEYCSVVWSPHIKTHENRIESVQKQFILFALRKLGWTVFPLPSYNARCMLISLETLAKRREFASLSFVNDLIANRINSTELLQTLNFYDPTRVLRAREPFALRFHRTDYAKHGPINRLMDTYNKFSDSINFTMTKSEMKKAFYSPRPV